MNSRSEFLTPIMYGFYMTKNSTILYIGSRYLSINQCFLHMTTTSFSFNKYCRGELIDVTWSQTPKTLTIDPGNKIQILTF